MMRMVMVVVVLVSLPSCASLCLIEQFKEMPVHCLMLGLVHFRLMSGKESTCQCRRCRFDPWVGKIPGGGNGNPLQYSCLGNPTDRGAWWATVYGATKSPTQLSDFLSSLCAGIRCSFGSAAAPWLSPVPFSTHCQSTSMDLVWFTS